MTASLRWTNIILCAFAFGGWTYPASAESSAPLPFGPARQTGKVENLKLSEASGIAASRRSDDVFWALNDSGNDPLLFAVGKDGKDLGSIRIADVPNLDWEDLVSFTHNGNPYLLIADIGDNQGAREKSYLHIIEEPDLSMVRAGHQSLVKRAWAMAFRFEDGPRDCESVAVIPATNQILLISKRDVPARVYTLPLMPEDVGAVQTALKIGTLDTIPQPEGAGSYLRNNGRFASQPTAMDIASDGSGVAMLTYVAIYYWPLEKGASIVASLQAAPVRIPLPFINQAEGLCFSRDGDALWVISESNRPPLFRLPRQH